MSFIEEILKCRVDILIPVYVDIEEGGHVHVIGLIKYSDSTPHKQGDMVFTLIMYFVWLKIQIMCFPNKHNCLST